MPDAVRLEAPAKVNLRLRVLAREETGYHALETVFCALSLADTLEVRRGGGGIALEVVGGIETGPAARNLAARAAEAFYARLGRAPAVALRVTKRIPAAAGLGGGSSDAAATLRALNVLEGEPLRDAELLALAIRLGADVPFFLAGSTLAFGWGRGERLLALPALPPRPVLVVSPGDSVSTADAFRALASSRGAGVEPEPVVIPAAALDGWPGLVALQGNDFEPVVTERIPVLVTALEALREAGAEIALLAGSGGCVFGVFPDERFHARAHRAIAAIGLEAWRCETLLEMPAPQVDPSGERV